MAIDVAALGCDFYTISGHKNFGPVTGKGDAPEAGVDGGCSARPGRRTSTRFSKPAGRRRSQQ